jgi:hypothetical protein
MLLQDSIDLRHIRVRWSSFEEAACPSIERMWTCCGLSVFRLRSSRHCFIRREPASTVTVRFLLFLVED